MAKGIRVLPCTAQKTLMEGLGFNYDSESHDYPEVTWTGHGISVELKETEEPKASEVMRVIVETAMNDARRRVKERFQRAFDEPFRIVG